MRIELDDQGIVVGVAPIESNEISASIRSKLIAIRPELAYIEDQGPESLMPIKDNTPLGINAIIEIFAESIYNSQLIFANFLNSWAPETAEGYLLDHIGATFFGLSRTRAEPSEANIILVADRGSQTYTKDLPKPLKVPQGFTVSISGRKFLTKYEQEFTNSFEESSATLVLTGVRYIKFEIKQADTTKVNVRFDTNNISHSTSESDAFDVAKALLKQVQKFTPWSSLSNKSIALDEVIGGVGKKDDAKRYLTLGFDEPVNITIPNTITNRVEVVEYGIEFFCRETEDDIEGLITAGTQVDAIDEDENLKITAVKDGGKGSIKKAYLWEDSTRVVQKESDEEYRERLKSTRTITAIGNTEAMKYMMLKIPGVTHCHIINNPTSNIKQVQPPTSNTAETEEDVEENNQNSAVVKLPKFNIEKHSFCVFVQGGAAYAIANTIYNCTPVGIQSSGHRWVHLTAANGAKVKVRFARPVPKSISILVKFTKGKSGLSVTDYQPPEHVVTSTIQSQILAKIGELEIGALLKVQLLGRDFIKTMPWMAHYIIKVAEKGGVTDKSSADFKEEKQLESEPYEFFFIKREDIVVEEESVTQ